MLRRALRALWRRLAIETGADRDHDTRAAIERLAEGHESLALDATAHLAGLQAEAERQRSRLAELEGRVASLERGRSAVPAHDRFSAVWELGFMETPSAFDRSPAGLEEQVLRHGTLGSFLWRSRQIPGWIRGEEALALAQASEALHDSPVIVLIGAFLGSSAVLLAGPCKSRGDGIVHCVDTFDAGGEEHSAPIYRAVARAIPVPLRQCFEETVREAGLWDWVVVHHGAAADVARDWQTPIDMLLLAADQSVEGARDIFLKWSPFLRPGGLLAIDNTADRSYADGHDGSYKVVRDFVTPPDYREVRRVVGLTFARRS